MKKINKTELTKFLIRLQDETLDLKINQMATQVVKDLKLERIHQRLTGNPKDSYKTVKTRKNYMKNQ